MRATPPGAATVFTADEIEELRPYTLHDAFDFVPGVRTIDDDVLGRRSGIGIRGAQPRRSRKVLLLEDGVPINAASYLDTSAHYTPPMERLELIDVFRGAGQIVHGPLNNYGIINFRTKQPTLRPETSISLGSGTRGNFDRSILHRQTWDNLGFTFSYAGRDADGAFDVERFRYNDFFASADWSPAPDHTLSGSFTYFRERSKYDETNLTIEEFAVDPRSKRRLERGAEFNNIAIDYFKEHIAHTYRVTDDVTLSSMAFATDLDRPRFESRRDGPEVADGYMRGREREYRTFGLESRVEVANTELFGLRHTFQGGVRFERQFFDNFNTVGRIGEKLDADNRGDRFAVVTPGVYREAARQEKLQASAASVFVQDAIRSGDFTITPGLRVERFTQSRASVFPEREPRERSAHTLLLPGISALYDGFDHTQLFAGVHRGYAPAIARTEDFPLVPETGINTQVGMRSSAVRGVSFEIAGFYNRIQNTIIRQTFTDEFGQNIFLNTSDSDARGIDVALRVDSLPFTGGPLNAFALLAWNYTDATFREGPISGNRVPEIPRHAGSLTLGLEHSAGWRFSATASYFGSFFTDVENVRELQAPDPDEPLEIVGRVPSHTTYSARLTYDIPNTGATLWIQGTISRTSSTSATSRTAFVPAPSAPSRPACRCAIADPRPPRAEVTAGADSTCSTTLPLPR